MSNMNWASISYAIRTAILAAVTASLAVLFTFDMGLAKNNKMTVKFSPEYTRQKKGSGKIEPSADMKTGVSNITKKATSNTKQKPPHVTKTPSPGGPAAIPYPN